MKRIAILAAALLAAPAAAQQADSAGVHVVRPGDTLWELARQYLQDPFRWPEIFRANPGVVSNPDRIFPRERLLIPGLPGAAAADATEVAAASAPPERTVFYRTETPAGPARSFRATASRQAPVVDPGEFYAAGFVADPAELDALGELTELVSPTVVPIEIDGQLQVYDRAFLRIARAGSIGVGDRVYLVRQERRIKPYGWVYEPTGMAQVEAVEGGTATVQVVELFDKVQVGDLALPVPAYRVPQGARPRPATGLEGRIVAFQNPQPVHSTYDIAFVDPGPSAGLQPGDELLAVIPATAERWGERPEIVVGLLQVVRAGNRLTAARVVNLKYPALEPGLVVRLVARMP